MTIDVKTPALRGSLQELGEGACFAAWFAIIETPEEAT